MGLHKNQPFQVRSHNLNLVVLRTEMFPPSKGLSWNLGEVRINCIYWFLTNCFVFLT